MGAKSTGILCVALAVTGLALAPVEAVEPPVRIYIDEAERYVYPLLSSAERRFGFSYRMTRDANVTTTVRDDTGELIRVIADEASEDVPPGGIFAYDYWDLKDEDDNPAPSGAYTLTMSAVDSSGNTSIDAIRIGIDRRTRPEIAAVASPRGDSVAATFTSPAGLPVATVRFDVVRDGFACAAQPATAGTDGVFGAKLALTSCAGGTQTLVGDISWHDALGHPHDTVTVGRQITVSDTTAPVLTAPRSQAGTLISPTTYPTFVMPLTATDSSPLGATDFWITDAAGRTVRSARAIEMSRSEPRIYRGEARWDGRNNLGVVQPTGRYTVNIRTRDSFGNERIVRTTKIDLTGRIAGTLSLRPIAGAPNTFRATVTVAAGLSAYPVIVQGGGFADHIPGTQYWTSIIDLSDSPPGTRTVTARIDWYALDDSASSSFTTAPVKVTITDTQPPVVAPSTEVTTMLLASPTAYASTFVQYAVNDPAGIAECRVWATNAAGATVMSPRSIDSCANGRSYHNWYATDSGGMPLPSGTYRLHTRFTDAGGLAATDVRTFVLDGRIPATISAVPDPSDPDVFDVTVTPASGAILTSATIRGTSATRDDAGVLRARLDLSDSPATTLTASIGWQTNLTPTSVSGRFETAPLPIVRVDREPPRAATPETQYSYLESIDAYDPVTVSFQLVERDGMRSAEYWITAPGGGVVVPRTSFEEIHRPHLTWRGVDDAGALLPPGTYTAHTRFEDLAGHVTDDVTATIVLGKVVPAQLTAPTGGVPVSGRQLIVVTPTPGIEILTTSVLFLDRATRYSPTGVTIYNPTSDGTWRAGYDTNYLSAGTVRYTLQTTWKDPRGFEQTYVGEGTILATGPPPVAAPTDVVATAGNQTVELTWTAPEGRLNGYLVEWAPTGGTWTGAGVPAGALGHTVRGLRNGTTYQFRVSASTKYLQSAPSAVLRRAPHALPPAPLSTAASPLRAAARIAWRPGKVLASHQAPTAFVVQTRRSGTPWRTVRVIGPTATWVIVRDLAAGQSHLFRVLARNSTGSTPGTTVVVRPRR